MLIFLYGPDTYRSRQKLKAIIDRHQSIHKSGLALTKFNQENFDLDGFRQKLKTVSMFNEKKLIILEDLLESFKDEQDTLRQLKNTEDNIVIFWEQELDKRGKVFKWLKDNAQCQEFKPLGTNELRRWVENKIKIKNDALEKLIFYVGSDLWRMSNEIEKLATFKRDEALITTQDIAQLISPQIDLNIFETIDALARGLRTKASELIWKHLTEGTDPSYLFSMILWQFRNLIKVKSGSTTGLHPFVVKKSTFLARRFTPENLKNIYQYLLNIDLSIKTGMVEPRVALDLLVMEI